MKKIFLALAFVASVSLASAQTKPAQKKESCEAKKECCAKKTAKAACCAPASKAKVSQAQAKKVSPST